MLLLLLPPPLLWRLCCRIVPLLSLACLDVAGVIRSPRSACTSPVRYREDQTAHWKNCNQRLLSRLCSSSLSSLPIQPASAPPAPCPFSISPHCSLSYALSPKLSSRPSRSPLPASPRVPRFSLSSLLLLNCLFVARLFCIAARPTAQARCCALQPAGASSPRARFNEIPAKTSQCVPLVVRELVSWGLS